MSDYQFSSLVPYSTSYISDPNNLQTIVDTNPAYTDAAQAQYDSLLSGSGGTSGGTTYSDPYAAYGGQTAYNQNISQYDQGISNTQAAIDRLGSQLNSGYGTIDASYQNALNQLLGNENQGKASYDTNVLQNQQDYVGGKNTVRSNAGSSLNGLLRLLGSRGAGGSSAARITAPGAIARQATLQQADLGNTYGHNAQGLDTAFNNFEIGINNQRSSASNQRDQQRQSLQQTIDNNKANLLQTLAQLTAQKTAYTGGNATAAAQPYLDQANSILNSLATYNTAPINYQTQAYTAPTLDKYLSSSITPTIQGQAPTNDYVSPYLATLLKKQPTTTGA
jgi:hypothetical protein